MRREGEGGGGGEGGVDEERGTVGEAVRGVGEGAVSRAKEELEEEKDEKVGVEKEEVGQGIVEEEEGREGRGDWEKEGSETTGERGGEGTWEKGAEEAEERGVGEGVEGVGELQEEPRVRAPREEEERRFSLSLLP